MLVFYFTIHDLCIALDRHPPPPTTIHMFDRSSIRLMFQGDPLPSFSLVSNRKLQP